jgi:Zn-dependent protease with chaperone function
MRSLLCLVFCLLAAFGVCAHAAETKAERVANEYAARELAAAPVHGNLPDYSLPPEALEKARHLGRVRDLLHFGGEAWGMVQLVLLLGLGAVGWMRDRAVRLHRSRWVQAYAFLLIFLLVRVLLMLPLNLYGHHLAVEYGLSVQRWPGWFGDLAKGVAQEWLIGGALLMLLFWIVGRLPRTWWLAFWVALVPIVLAGVCLAPVVSDPLFNRFTPLAATQPALAAQLEHMGVPRSRQFLMLASAKVTTPNAYVTGLGPTKRIVVWDTSITPGKPTSPEILWMVGHESGHYALHHVLAGTLLTLAGLLPLLYLVYRLAGWALGRFGARWRVAGPADWGAFAVLLLAFSLINALAEPVSNTVSRAIEHNADIYGEEAIHGLVPDPQTAVVRENDSDGLRALEDPHPPAFDEFWTYNHPATGRRAAFGRAYDPWAAGMEPKYFKGRQ